VRCDLFKCVHALTIAMATAMANVSPSALSRGFVRCFSQPDKMRLSAAINPPQLERKVSRVSNFQAKA
jgi:hypothetical protein